ncbi:MAG: HAD-IIIA family hydrolase [Oscillospiraceae bacterium]|jgi:histidinol-phosphate phosphatase family protein|nr:HAD-IIIA family hydrolase [Oscillospiraceae bacterium]
MKIAAFIGFQGTLGGGGLDDVRSLKLFPFAAEAVKLLNRHSILAIGVTNQSHISRGEMTRDEYNAGLQDLQNELAHGGARLDAVYCCPHTDADKCNCRKPRRGMIDSACRDFDIDLEGSYVIGDMGASDMVLAHNIGAKGILVLTGVGKGSLGEFRFLWQDIEPYFVADDILAAAERIAFDCS